MSTDQTSEEDLDEPTEASPLAGGCVLLGLTGATLAGTWAMSPTAAVLTVWAVGAGTVWRLVRRTANPAPPPVPEGAADTNPQFSIVEDREGHCTVQWQKGVKGS